MGFSFDTQVAQPSPAALDLKPPQSTGPLDALAQVQEMRARGQQMQAQDMENQQRALDLKDQQTMRQVLPQMMADPKYRGDDGAFDWKKALPDLAGQVQPKTAFGLQATILGNQEKAAQIAKAQGEANAAQQKLREAETDYMGRMFLGIKNANYDPAITEGNLLHAESINPEYKGAIEQVRQLIAAHPENLQKIVDQGIAQSGAASTQLREQTTAALTNQETQLKIDQGQRAQAIQELSGIVDQQGNVTDPQAFAALQQKYPKIMPASSAPRAVQEFLRSGVPVEKQPTFDLDRYKAQIGLMGNSEYDQFLAQYARKLGTTPALLTPDQALQSFQQFAEFKQDPQMRAAALAQKNLADILKKRELDQMPTQEDANRLADDILNHRIAPAQLSEIRGRGNGALGIMIGRALPKGFNWEDADAEYNLSKSPGFQQSVRYMDYVGSSIGNVITAADKLNNTGVRSINAVKNWAANQLNGVDIARFNTDRVEVADAIAKVLQGGGTGSGTSDMKLKQGLDLIKETDDPTVVRTVAGEIQKLIGNRRQTLTRGTFMENAAPAGENPGAAQGGAPKIGDVRSYQGHNYKFDGKQWVRQ